MRPGQFGPRRRVGRPARNAFTRTMSATGMPSVMQAISGTPAAAASKIASAAAAGGTKISAQSAPASRAASATVFQTGKPSCTVPPLPGVTPPTTFVPYSLQRRAWNVPSRPVIPWTTTRVSRPTRMLMGSDFDLSTIWPCEGLTHLGVVWKSKSDPGRSGGEGDDLLSAVAHVGGAREVEPRLGQHLLAELDVRPFHPHDDGHPDAELLDGRDQASCQPVAAEDPAEHVDEDGLHARIAREDPEGALDLLGRRAAAHVEEVRGGAAGELHDVHRRHGEPGAVDHAADGAVELDVVQPLLRRLDVQRVLLVDVAERRHLGVPEEGIVVEVELEIGRAHPPVPRHGQRVN